MKSFKKITAATLTMAMIAASSVTALAEETPADPNSGSLGGTGTVEGVVNKDVFKVKLPTVAEGATTFNYIMDPQGLIKATAAAAHTGKTFKDGDSVYFENVSGTPTENYSATSDALKITNMSTMAVDVTLEASVAAVDGLIMADSATFEADDVATKLYLAIIGGEGDSAQTKAIKTDSVKVTAQMAAAADGSYKVSYNTTDGEYVYDLTDAAKAEDYAGFSTYSFKLTGACNTNKDADWTELKDANPEVTVVWSVADPTAKKNVTESDGTKDIVIYYEGAKPDKVTLTPPSTAVKNTAVDVTAGTTLTIDDEKITLKASYIATLKKSANYGTGTYKVAVNGKSTDIVIK